MPPSSEDFPPLFASSDAASLASQQRYLVVTRLRLGLTVLAAGLAAFAGDAGHPDNVNWILLMAALAFAGAMVLETGLSRFELEETWYDGRAVAESVKTIAWRFAVGGLPYEIDSANADDRVRREVGLLLGDSPKATITQAPGEVVTTWMADLRASAFEDRRRAYLDRRIREQREWYEAKATHNKLKSRMLRKVLILLNLAGASAAFGMAFGWPSIDLAGVLSAAVGAIAAWLAVKQHESVGRAYTQAAHELALVVESLSGIGTEQDWAAAVADAEEAVSREHTMWRARKVVGQ